MRKTKTKKKLVKAKPKKKKLIPDLVGGKFCICSGDGLLWDGLTFSKNAPAIWGDKKAAEKDLNGLIDGSMGLDATINAALVQPVKKYFANNFYLGDQNKICANICRKNDGPTTFKTAIREARQEYRDELKDHMTEVRKEKQRHAAAMREFEKAINKVSMEIVKFEKSVKSYG